MTCEELSACFFGFPDPPCLAPRAAQPLAALTQLDLPVVPGFCLTDPKELKPALARLEASQKNLKRDFPYLRVISHKSHKYVRAYLYVQIYLKNQKNQIRREFEYFAFQSTERLS